MVGELSATRQAFECRIGPRQFEHPQGVNQPRTTPVTPWGSLPLELLNRIPEVSFQLDEERFAKNARSARRGAVAGPSGMTSEHLFPMLENDGDLQALTEFASMMARRDVPPQAKEVLRVRAHIMQSLTDLDPRTTILSVDGVWAFDLISRNSMMEGFHILVHHCIRAAVSDRLHHGNASALS